VTSPLLSNELLFAQNVQPKATTPGAVQETPPASGTAPQGGSSSLFGMLPMVLMFALFIPILFMSSRRQKKEAQARASLKKGDRVTTNAGLIGELVEMDERVAKVKISPSVTVQFVANTVAPYVEPEKAQAKDLKEAKAVSDKK
jgi:preprotein translocase subunit YajC